MNLSDWIATLQDQVAAALAEGIPSPVELAALAGELARQGVPVPAEVLRWRDSGGAELVRADLVGLPLADLVTPPPEDEPTEEERLDALFAIDELCVAAAWVGCPEVLAKEFDICVRSLEAFPDEWVPHSELGARLLDRLPAADLVRPLWKAVQASAQHQAEITSGVLLN